MKLSLLLYHFIFPVEAMPELYRFSAQYKHYPSMKCRLFLWYQLI